MDRVTARCDLDVGRSHSEGIEMRVRWSKTEEVGGQVGVGGVVVVRKLDSRLRRTARHWTDEIDMASGERRGRDLKEDG